MSGRVMPFAQLSEAPRQATGVFPKGITVTSITSDLNEYRWYQSKGLLPNQNSAKKNAVSEELICPNT